MDVHKILKNQQPEGELSLFKGVNQMVFCAPIYWSGPVVNVSAKPDSDSIFDYWELDSVNVGSVNPYIITMNSIHALQAFFAPAQRTVLVTGVVPFGTVAVQGSGYNDGIEVTRANQGSYT